MDSSGKIKTFILNNISLHQKDIIYTAINQFGISRQAVLKHMNALINDKKVMAYGKTRDRTYQLIPQVNFSKSIAINDDFICHEVVQKNILVHLKPLAKNIYQICEFSIEALLNNIVDHAQATNLYVKLYLTYTDLHIIISDNGTGLFRNIKSKLNLDSIQLALMEVAKGQVTTDPDHHSGDELNTVVNLFDSVKIDSSGFGLVYSSKDKAWQAVRSKQQQGTRVHLQIDPKAKRSCEETFKYLFKNQKECLCIPINLLKEPGKKTLNSRVIVKSIFWNITSAKNIQFDFGNVDLIGPAVADELVRQARSINREVVIKWMNCNETIDLLMRRALKRIF